ncbi:hypothetical protein BDZ89DRAFT_1082125, partial [Hymenopellis radicata]
REGFIPTTAHLQDYVRVFANGGAIQDPERYRQEIAQFMTDHPLGQDSADDPTSAFHFLRRLTTDSTPSLPGPNMTERQWNAAFASAAARHGQKNMRMSIYNYTILIRALLLRKQYGLARMYWHHLCGCVNVSLPAQYRLANPVVMNIVCMNDLLWSLRYMRRPDAVFLLWDNMTRLYGLYPISSTFSILLKCVRMTFRLDDTPTGALSQLAFFRGRPSMFKTRDEAVAVFKSVLGDNRNPTPEPYKPFSVWKDPAGRAQELFWQAMHAHRRPHGPERWLDGTLTNVVPSGANCFDYAVVAMLSGRAEELPKILYAMEELGIAPVEGMVPLVLTVWHDVCAENPREGDNPWRTLVDWISEWLGEKALPSLEDMRAWRVKVLQMKGLVPSTWETAGRRYSSEREDAKFQAMWRRPRDGNEDVEGGKEFRPMRAKERRRLRRRREREAADESS